MLKPFCLAAVLAWPSCAFAGAVASGTLPEKATFLLGEEAPAEVRQCLTGLGMREAEAPAYLVQFGRVSRLRKALVQQGAKDAASRPHQTKQFGKTLEIASLAFVEVATGKVVYLAEVSRKVRRKPAATGLVSDLCTLVKAPPPPAAS